MEQAPSGRREFHVPGGMLVGAEKSLGCDIIQGNLAENLKR